MNMEIVSEGEKVSARRAAEMMFVALRAAVSSLNDATLCAREHGCVPMRRRGDNAGALHVLRVLEKKKREPVAKAAAVVAFVSNALSSDSPRRGTR